MNGPSMKKAGSESNNKAGNMPKDAVETIHKISSTVFHSQRKINCINVEINKRECVKLGQ